MKKLFLIAAILTAAFQCFGANVDAMSAQAVAQRFMQSQAVKGGFSAQQANVRLAKTELNSSNVNQAAYYIFNSDKGFVIVSGDDRARDILAYGERPLDVNNIPENMTGLLLLYKRQVEFLQANPGYVVKPALTARYNGGVSVDPLLTALWDQDAPYYNMCPTYNGSRCLTGCPATSLSMVFYFWKFPTDETPAVEGYTNESYGFQVPALPPTTFDWEHMRDTYTGSYTTQEGNAVAELMRYVGQEEKMDYTPSGSGAFGADILRAVLFFGYDEGAQLTFKSVADDYGNDEVLIDDYTWDEMLQTELVEGRPVVYCAYDYSWFGWSGHAFNVDGYDASNGKYHVNYGWSGSGNGWFALNAFDGGGYTFNIEQQMIHGIQPVAMPRVKVSTTEINMKAYPNKTATASFTVKGNDLITNDVTLTVNDPNGVFSIDPAHVSVADAKEGKKITVTYAPKAVGNYTATVTVNCPDTDPKTVTLNGTSELEIYKPVMLKADENAITATSFRADWSDNTPAENVASRTLEVMSKPDVMLMGEADFSGVPKDNANHAADAANYLPEGWTFTGSHFYLDGGFVSPGRNSSINPNCDFTGFEKVSVIIKAKNYTGGGNTTITVQTDAESKTFNLTDDVETYLACLSLGRLRTLKIVSGYYPEIQSIAVYGGEITDPAPFTAAEQGDATYRLITGIDGMSYTVTGLTPGGTFIYRVKDLYIDGTESAWSGNREVTLLSGGETLRGDANGNGTVDVEDIAALISYLLNGTAVDMDGADCDLNGTVDVEDIAALISYLLTETW